jgi:GNAT superfamily N-acetyltransferase
VPGARAAGTGLVVAGVREAYEEAAAHTAAAACTPTAVYENPVASGWQVAPARPADRPALQALFAACSEESVRLRFFGQLRAFPADYLDAALAGVPHVHDAVVAYRGGDRTRLAGMASLVAGPATAPASALTTATRPEAPVPPEAGPAEVAVLVSDAWQRQGAGTAMISALLARARERGVVRVRASVLPGRTGLLAALSRRLPPEPGRSSYTRDGLSAVYKLQ